MIQQGRKKWHDKQDPHYKQGEAWGGGVGCQKHSCRLIAVKKCFKLDSFGVMWNQVK